MVCLECTFSHMCSCNTHTLTHTPKGPSGTPRKTGCSRSAGGGKSGRAGGLEPKVWTGTPRQVQASGPQAGTKGSLHTLVSSKSGPPGTLGGLSRSVWVPTRRSRATLFVTALTWTRRRPISRQMRYLHAVGYYLMTKKDKPQIHAPARRHLENITLHAETQRQKRMCYTLPSARSSRDTRELLGVTEMVFVSIWVVATEVHTRGRSH